MSDDERPDPMAETLAGREPETRKWTGDELERRRDRERLINFVAAYVRALDAEPTQGQPGRAYAEVHYLEDAFGLFERRTVMRWLRQREVAGRPSGIPPSEGAETLQKG